jgi:DHA1 family bicyclomycin/chloramphenicol resistance-like MFS transporter
MKAFKPRLPSIPVLVGLTAMMPLGMHLLLPAIPSIARDFAVSVPTVQWSITLYMAAVAIAQLVYGPLSDQFGRRPPLLIGLLIFIAGSAMCAVATSAPMLLWGRVIQGIGACTGLVLGRAMVRDVYPPERASTVLAYISMAIVIFPALAPMFGGALLLWFDWRAPFLVTAFAGVVLLVIGLRLAETNQRRTRFIGPLSLFRDFGALLRFPPFAVPALVLSLSSTGFFAFIATAPILSDGLLRIPPHQYGFYFAILPLGFFAGSFLSTRLTPRLGPDRLCLYAFTLSAILAVAMLGLVLFTPATPLSLFGPVALINLASATAMPALTVRALGASPTLIGAASGLLGFLQMSLGAFGTQLVGFLHNGTAVPVAAILAGSALLAMAMLYVERFRRPPDA